MSLAIARMTQAITTPAGRAISSGAAALTGGTAATLGVQYGAGVDFSKPAPPGEISGLVAGALAIVGIFGGIAVGDGLRGGHSVYGAAVGGITAALAAIPMVRRGMAD